MNETIQYIIGFAILAVIVGIAVFYPPKK